MVRTGDEEDTFAWKAEGECARCATPIGRHAAGEGVWSVTCRSCGEVTPLRARKAVPMPSVRLDDDPSTTPVGLPKLSRRERKRAAASRGHAATLPKVERRRRNLWAAPTLALALVIVAFAGVLAFGPVPTPDASAESTSGASVATSQVQFFLNDTATGPDAVLLQLLHEGALVHEERVETDAGGEEAVNDTALAFTAVTPSGPLQLRVLDEAGALLLDTTFDAGTCAGGLLRIALALEGETARVEDTRCVTG